MDDRHEKPSPHQYAAAQSLIDHYIQHPPQRPALTREERYAETERSRAIGGAAVQAMRELACKQTGLTMEQLLEAESMVNHPRSVIDSRLVPGVMARSRMKAAGVPERFILHVADKQPVECKALKRVRAFLASKQGFLMLAGGKGNYKTGSSSWALGQIDGGAFVDVGSIIRISISDRPAWERVLRAPIVVLDDLGTEKVDQRGAFIAAFHELFNSTYANCRRMIMNGNITAEQFKASPERGGYGERVADRFREAGAWYDVPGESVRSSMRLPSHWADDDERQPGEEG